MANTKMNEYMKLDRKEMLMTFLFDGGKLFNFEGFTVAIKPAFMGSNMALVSTSCASHDEQKFRRKVGEYHALHKMNIMEYMQVPLEVENFESFASTLAEFFNFDPLDTVN